MSDEVRELTALQAQIEGVRGQLERAASHLAAATVASGPVADAVRSALDDLAAVGKRMARLHQTVCDQITAVTITMPCARCGSQMPATARRCARCSEPVAQA